MLIPFYVVGYILAGCIIGRIFVPKVASRREDQEVFMILAILFGGVIAPFVLPLTAVFYLGRWVLSIGNG